MNQPNHPDAHPNDSSAWESAMSRDFDARVRDLHEAPLSLDHVKGKATTIRRNRRIAVAGSVLAVAAVVTPVALLAANGEDRASEPGFADTSTTDASETVTDPNVSGGVSYIEGSTWHLPDGTEVQLPADRYESAVLWEGQVVALRETNKQLTTADVVAPDGTVVEEFETTRSIAASEDHATIAYVDGNGDLVARWGSDEAVVATGLDASDSPAAVTGDCATTCTVYVNHGGIGNASAYSGGTETTPIEGATTILDATAEGEVTAIDEVNDDLTTCGGLYDLGDDQFRWHGCDFRAADIAPGGGYVVGLPSYASGPGDTSISVLDASTGTETGRWSVDGAFVGRWAWVDGDTLAFTAYDGANWHVLSLEADGEVRDLAGPVEGSEVGHPFVLVEQ